MLKRFAVPVLTAAIVTGCVSMPPPPNRSPNDPSNPASPHANVRHYKPNLVASTKVYLDPSVASDAQQMGMGNMPGMDHSQMPGMDHSKMQNMDHSKMQNMDHSKMDHGATVETSPPPDKKAMENEMTKTSDEMKKLSDEMKKKSDAKAKEDKPRATSKTQATIYTCPMHPEVQQSNPGKCPKCGMTLVKKK